MEIDQQPSLWTEPVEPEPETTNYTFDLTHPNMIPSYIKSRQSENLDEVAKTLPPLTPDMIEHLCPAFRPHPMCPSTEYQDLHPSATIRQPKYLAQKYPHPLDANIIFVEEPHAYFLVDGERKSCQDVISVTTLVHTFFPGFDSKAQSNQTFASKTFKDTSHRKSNKYFGCKTPEDIAARWNSWADLGTKLHANIESFFNHEAYTVIPENEKPFAQFQKLIRDRGFWNYQPFRTEFCVYDPETRVAGQIDFLGLFPDNNVVIIDWKRVGNINTCCFNRLLGKEPTYGFGCCGDLENCKYIQYSLQVNIYKYILEKHYGFYVKQMILIQLHPEIKEGNVIICPNLQKWVTKIMATRQLARKMKCQTPTQ